MNLPFLPEVSIFPVFNLLNVTSLTIVGENDLRFTKFKRYIEKQWIRRTPANELSIFNATQTTNNGAEIYHAKLKSEVVVKQSRIWHFVQVLNNIIADTDIDLERLRNGIEISRPIRKKSSWKKSSYRSLKMGNTHRFSIYLHWRIQMIRI